MNRATLSAAMVVVGLSTAQAVQAASFEGYSETSEVFFDDTATFDYDPLVLGGTIFGPLGLVDVTLSTDLSNGSLTLFDSSFATILNGALVDTVLNADNDIEDDMFSMLFELSTGTPGYAVATFTGDLDRLGFTDFFTDGVLFVDGVLTINGAEKDSTSVIPLPAGLPLLLTGVGGLLLLRRRSHN